MKTTLDILVAARALIEKPENWCKGSISHSGGGSTSYCAMGALDKATIEMSDFQTALKTLQSELPQPFRNPSGAHILGSHPVAHFNDTHFHSQVLALFDRAIAAEKRKLGIIDDKIAHQVKSLLANAVASAAVPEPVT